MSAQKRKAGNNDGDGEVSAFAGFTLPKAVKKAKIEKSEHFKRVEREEREDEEAEEVAAGGKIRAPITIPMIKENKWSGGIHRAEKRSKNGETSSDTTLNPVEQLEKSIAEEEERKKQKAEAEEAEAEKDSDSIPLIMQNRVPGLEKLANDDEKFQLDMSLRPDAIDFNSEVYDNVPVEAFGAALLRGMGWSKGGKIGRRNAGVVKPIEFLQRGHRLGLGATESKPKEKTRKDGRKWINKPGETNKPKELMRVKPDQDGKVRHFRNLDEQLVPVKDLQPRVNALVEIISGKHKRLFGRIVKLSLSDSKCSIRLNINEEEVSVSLRRLEVLDEHSLPAGHAAFNTTRSSKSTHNHSSSSKSKSRSHKQHSSSSKKSGPPPPRLKWVVPHIRVRIVSKSVAKGKFYCKKGRIEDIPSPFEFMVVMDSGQTLTGLRESDVETVAPKLKNKVILVSGRHKGSKGTLIEKSSSQNKAVVQLFGNLDVLECTLDDICEYLNRDDEDFE